MLTKLLISAIKFYRNYISCLMLPRCRFYPTCSAFFQEALEKKGLFKGVKLGCRRLLRCRPFSRGQFYDPVDESVE